MKHILVPTNLSSTAERDFRVALDIASKSNSTVIWYDVYTPVKGSYINLDTVKKIKKYALTETDLIKRLQPLKKKVMPEVRCDGKKVFLSAFF